MPPKQRARKPYRYADSDNAWPGGPTTMDILVRWITTPGNVKRWRTIVPSQIIREIVEMMQDEGLAHRKAPFVRHKLDAMEKKYIAAKQWLMETGMYDVFIRGKASKEVKAHVESMCLHFKKLDVAFSAVPFSKENAETIDLGDESAEEEEVEVMKEKETGHEEESEGNEHKEEEEAGDQSFDHTVNKEKDSNQAKKSTSKKVGKETAVSTEVRKKKTFRDRLFSSRGDDAQVETLTVAELHKPKKGLTKRLKSPTITISEEEKASIPTEPPKRVDEHVLKTGKATEKEKKKSPADPIQNKTKSKEQVVSRAVETATRKSTPEAVKSVSVPATVKTSKAKAIALPSTINDGKETTVKALGNKKVKPQVTVIPGKRKVSEAESSAVKRTRMHEQEARNEELAVIERNALVRRLEEEEKHRHKVFELELARMESELESQQIQMLFEKASARKKLDQLGVSMDEIDRILPM